MYLTLNHRDSEQQFDWRECIVNRWASFCEWMRTNPPHDIPWFPEARSEREATRGPGPERSHENERKQSRERR